MKLTVHFACALSLGALVVACAASSPTTGDGTDTNPTVPKGKGKSSSSSTSSSGASGESSSSGGASSTSSSGGASSTSSSGGSSSGTTSSGGSSSGGGGDAACAATADLDSCVTCCDTNHTAGANTFYGTLQTCYCKTANCKSACNTTLCAATPANPSTACGTCLDGVDSAGGCDNNLQTACTADPDCIAFNDCANTNCAGKN